MLKKLSIPENRHDYYKILEQFIINCTQLEELIIQVQDKYIEEYIKFNLNSKTRKIIRIETKTKCCYKIYSDLIRKSSDNLESASVYFD